LPQPCSGFPFAKKSDDSIRSDSLSRASRTTLKHFRVLVRAPSCPGETPSSNVVVNTRPGRLFRPSRGANKLPLRGSADFPHRTSGIRWRFGTTRPSARVSHQVCASNPQASLFTHIRSSGAIPGALPQGESLANINSSTTHPPAMGWTPNWSRRQQFTFWQLGRPQEVNNLWGPTCRTNQWAASTIRD